MAMSCGHGRASRWSRLTRSLRLQAEQQVESCEYCHSDDAEIPFDRLLAEETGKHGPSEFMLTEPAVLPICKHPVTEKTLVERKVDCRQSNLRFRFPIRVI
jgi:hypothetical protein